MPATFRCTLRARSGHPVQRLILDVPSDLRFVAGQYVEVLHPQGAIPLSIASGPRRLPELHLHYRSTPGAREAAWMDELLDTAGTLEIRGPQGDVKLPGDPATALLLVAGGTGIAQVRSILDELSGRPHDGRVSVLWCVDHSEDLYCQTELEALAGPGRTVEAIVDPRRGPENRGLARLRSIADEARAAGSADPWVLLGGSPAFVYATADCLVAAGIDAAHLHADVFAYAPRPARGS